MRKLLFALPCVLALSGCIPEIAATRNDDPDNPPDTAIEGTVTVLPGDPADTFFFGGRWFTSDPALDLTITFAGAATKAGVRVNGESEGELTAETARTVQLDPTVQNHTILVTFRDNADHQGGTIRIEVEYDASPPARIDAFILTDHRPVYFDTTANDWLVYPACDTGTQTVSEPVADVRILAEDASTAPLEIRLVAKGCSSVATDPDFCETTCDAGAFVDTTTGGTGELPFEPFFGFHRVLLDGNDGEQAICMQLRDAADNRAAPEQVGVILFDSHAPTSPRIVSGGAVVDATGFDPATGAGGNDYPYPVVFTQSSDTEGNFAGYQVFGGYGEQAASGNGADTFELCLGTSTVDPNDPSLTGCNNPTAGADVQVNFELWAVANERFENILRVRGIDCAGNASDDDFRVVTNDQRYPAAPTNVVVIEENGAVSLRWQQPAPEDADVVSYRVYYGTVSRNFGGTFAANGPSPVDVGRVQSFRLTGLPNGTRMYISVTALDDTELIEPGAAGCDSEILQPVSVYGVDYCAEAHQSPFSEEVAVLPNPVTPESQRPGMLNGSWHRIVTTPNLDTLFALGGSAFYAFGTNLDLAGGITTDTLALANADGSPVAPLLAPNNPLTGSLAAGSPFPTDGFASDIAVSTGFAYFDPDRALNGQIAYVANGADGILVVSVLEDGSLHRIATVGNPVSFTREVEIVRSGPDNDEALVAGGDQGLQLFSLSDPNDGSVTHLSPAFTTSVFANKSVLAMTWNDADSHLWVSLQLDGIAVLRPDLRLQLLPDPPAGGGGTPQPIPNPFCLGEFSDVGVPDCRIVDIERATFPDRGAGTAREVLLLLDRDRGLATVDVTGLVTGSGTLAQLGFCTFDDGCFRALQPGTLRGVEVVEPWIFVLGDKAAELPPIGGAVGPAVVDDLAPRGATLEVLFATNSDAFDDGGLRFPVSIADPGAYGDGWVSFAAGADVKVVGGSLVVAQGSLGLAAYPLGATGPDFLKPITWTPGSPLPQRTFAPISDLTGTGAKCIRPIRTVGNARRLAMTGSRLVVADGAAGAQVLSLQHPGRPIHELELPIGKTCDVQPQDLRECYDVAVTGPFAFLATAGSGVRVFDLRPLMALAPVQTTPTLPGNIASFASVVLGRGAGDLDGIIHDRGLPGPVVDPFPSRLAVRVAARRDRLWVLGYDTNWLCDPGDPACSQRQTAAATNGDSHRVHLKLAAWNLTKLYDRAGFLTGTDGAASNWDSGLDSTPPWEADLEGLVDLGRGDLLGVPIDGMPEQATRIDELVTNLEVNGAYLYLGVNHDAFHGVARIKTDPATWPKPADGFEEYADAFSYPNAAPRQVRVRGTLIYVADANRGLVLLDEPTGEVVATFSPNGAALSLAVESNLVYLGTDQGLQVIAGNDDGDTVELNAVGFLKTAAPVRDVLIRESLAYLATGVAGLRVAQVADLTHPEPFAVAPFTEENGARTGQFSISGAVAYLISEGLDLESRFDNTLLTLDLRAPSTPVAQATTGEYAPGTTHVAVDDQTVFATSLAPAPGAPVEMDRFEDLLGGGGNNDNSTLAATLAPGTFSGLTVEGDDPGATGDQDWYLLEYGTQGLRGPLTLQLDLGEGGVGTVLADIVVDAGCVGMSSPLAIAGDTAMSSTGPVAGPPVLHLVEGENRLVDADGQGCVFIRVSTFVPGQRVRYSMTIDWPSLTGCVDNTGSPVDDDIFDGTATNNNACVRQAALATASAVYRLCTPSAGAADFFTLAVQPGKLVGFYATAQDCAADTYELDDASSVCPPGTPTAQPGPLHYLLLDNSAGPTVQTFTVRLGTPGGGQPKPILIRTEETNAAPADYYDRERATVTDAPAVISGDHFDLALAGAGAGSGFSEDRFRIAAEQGEEVCVSVDDTAVGAAAYGDCRAFIDNSAIAHVYDDFGAEVRGSGIVPAGLLDHCFDVGGVPVDGTTIRPGVFEIVIQNPKSFPVRYDLEVTVADTGSDILDSAEPNGTMQQTCWHGLNPPPPFAPCSTAGEVNHSRLPASNAYLSPLYISINDTDWYNINLEPFMRLQVTGERMTTSDTEFALALHGQNGTILQQPLVNTRFSDVLDYVNGDTAQTVFVEVNNIGVDDPGFGDYYYLDVEISDGTELQTRVELFDVAPFDLIPAGSSVAVGGSADALATWGPYAYHLVYNDLATLYVTRFADQGRCRTLTAAARCGGQPPCYWDTTGSACLFDPSPAIDLAAGGVEGEVRFPGDSPNPPFAIAAEGPRIFIAETDSSAVWFVDVSPVLAGTGAPAIVAGPRTLFTREAATVDGMLLHAGILFVANAARGAIYALDVSDAATTFEPPGNSLVREPLAYPVIGFTASTNAAGTLAMSGHRLVTGLVGTTGEGPRSVGSAIFSMGALLELNIGGGGDGDGCTVNEDCLGRSCSRSQCDPFSPIELAPIGASTIGATDLQVVGPYMYVSNENGFQVLDLR